MVNWPLLYKDINRFRAGRSFNTLAAEWGIPASTFTRIKQGKAVSVDMMAGIAADLGQDIGKYVSNPKRVVR